MTAARPAALNDTEGLRGDLAARNRTVHFLARKFTDPKRLHPPTGACAECKTARPCQCATETTGPLQ